MASKETDDPQPGTSGINVPIEMEQRIVEIAHEKPNGFTAADISKKIPNLTSAQLAAVLNKLLKNGEIIIFKKGNTLFYRLKMSTNKGSDKEEKIIYSIIESAGNKGMWMQKIRYQANLGMQQTLKIIKSLESKKLIKSVKSVAAARKVVYMLYNLEPDRSITGGAWYQDQDFEAEFVDVLNQQCYRFLEMKKDEAKNIKGGPIAVRNAAYASSEEVLKFITDLGISKVTLSITDLEAILNTVVYGGKAERIQSEDGKKLYRAIEPLVTTTGMTSTPCGLCPVIQHCSETGAVNPYDCPYMKEWLESSHPKKRDLTF